MNYLVAFDSMKIFAFNRVGLLWKIFSGYKKSTNQEASIFLLEKKQLDRLSKNDREAVLDVLRKGISQLSRLRHPQVLIVQHTLEESRFVDAHHSSVITRQSSSHQ